MAQKSFQATVVTPERSVLEAELTYAQLPAHDGQLGVMAGRAPLLLRLDVGKLELTFSEGGEKRKWLIDEGFAQMRDNRLTLLTERVIPPDQIDREAARAAFDDAADLPSVTDSQFEKRRHDLAMARAMMALSKE